jgi:hypothetical protein
LTFGRFAAVGRRDRISIDLPRESGRVAATRRDPPFDHFVRVVQAIIRAAVDGDHGLASGRCGRVDLDRSVKGARPVDTKA